MFFLDDWKKILVLLLFLWLIFFSIDYIRTVEMNTKPIFTVYLADNEDLNSGTYQGVGYKISLEGYDENGTFEVSHVKITFFGFVLVNEFN